MKKTAIISMLIIGMLTIVSFAGCIGGDSGTETQDEPVVPVDDNPVADNVAPVALMAISGTMEIGQEITFDGTGSTDEDGTIADWAWDFESDGTIDANGDIVTHTYDTAGTYTVTLTVTDDVGATNSKLREIEIADAGEGEEVEEEVEEDTGPVIYEEKASGSVIICPDGIATGADDYGWDFSDAPDKIEVIVEYSCTLSAPFEITLMSFDASETRTDCDGDGSIAQVIYDNPKDNIAVGHWRTHIGKGAWSSLSVQVQFDYEYTLRSYGVPIENFVAVPVV